MILSDRGIAQAIRDGDLNIDPYRPEKNLQPASYDLSLGESYVINGRPTTNDCPVIWPEQFLLACTVEVISLGPAILGTVHGRSSLGRLGLMVHITAGLIDPGFQGQITLELLNVSADPIRLRAGDRIVQITFQRLDQPCAVPYGSPERSSKYQLQSGATPSRWRMEVR